MAPEQAESNSLDQIQERQMKKKHEYKQLAPSARIFFPLHFFLGRCGKKDRILQKFINRWIQKHKKNKYKLKSQDFIQNH